MKQSSQVAIFVQLPQPNAGRRFLPPMTDYPKPGAQAMKTFKVTVPQATYDAFERTTQQRGGSVKEYVAPLLIALGAGEIQPRYDYAIPPPPAPVPAAPLVADRIHGLPRLSAACRALLTLVCQEYEQTGGDRTDATNAELGQVLHVHGITIARAVQQLQLSGWLLVKLYANGANGRQLWPSERARAVYGAR